MKKNYIFTTLFFLITVLTVKAQLPVSHSASNKNAVLEEFTGIHCGYCPDGHKIANQIQSSHPDDVVLINVHTGNYANPRAGEPDFRTSFGSSLASQSGLSGYPSGTVNRHVFSGSNTAMGRGSWSNSVNQIISQPSYCNIALEGTIDTQSRLLTVNVELFYTGNNAPSQNFINVVLLQDNVQGPQTGAANYYPQMILPNGNYRHMHMLRHMLTGQWGDQVSTTTQNTLIQKQYTYTIPYEINGTPVELGNLHLAAFVSENHQEIITGSNGEITLTNFAYTNNASIENVQSVNSFFNNSFTEEICSSNQFKSKIRVNNLTPNDITSLNFIYSMNGGNNQSYNWTGSIKKFAGDLIEIPGFNFNVLDNNNYHIEINTVNGNPDELNSDSNLTINVIKTNKIGIGTSYNVIVTQDQYGSETTWKILDDNGNQVASGGPYSDLSSAGILEHTHNVNLPYGCYSFEINDGYGDGICCSYGNGSYKLETSNGTVVFNGTGNFSSKATNAFTTSETASISDNETSFFNIYPNPSKGYLTIKSTKKIKIEITNILGKKIYPSFKVFNSKTIDLTRLNNGVYFIKINDEKKTITKKIILKK